MKWVSSVSLKIKKSASGTGERVVDLITLRSHFSFETWLLR
jgi:hypothetical protein